MLLEEMSMEFEEAVKLGGGWTELALPSEEEAHRYFASFRRAPPDNSALAPSTQVGRWQCMHKLPLLGRGFSSRALSMFELPNQEAWLSMERYVQSFDGSLQGKLLGQVGH